MKKISISFLVKCGLLTALTTLFTLISIPVGTLGAYVNAGDSIVYASAFIIGSPWCAAVAGIGSMIADIILGSALYAPATFVIKAAMAFTAAMLMKKLPKFKLTCSLLLAGLIMPIGYMLYELLLIALGLYGEAAPIVAVTNMLMNLIQYAAGCVIGIALIQIAKRFSLGSNQLN